MALGLAVLRKLQTELYMNLTEVRFPSIRVQQQAAKRHREVPGAGDGALNHACAACNLPAPDRVSIAFNFGDECAAGDVVHHESDPCRFPRITLVVC